MLQPLRWRDTVGGVITRLGNDVIIVVSSARMASWFKAADVADDHLGYARMSCLSHNHYLINFIENLRR